MKKLLPVFLALFTLYACPGTDDVNDEDNDTDQESNESKYRQHMRDFVIDISEYAKSKNNDFIIIPQNGVELATENSDEEGDLNEDYVNAIDGQGQEDLFYGYNNDNEATPTDDREYLQLFLDKLTRAGKTVLITDYCWTQSKMDDSYTRNSTAGYVSFAADERELNNIPAYPLVPNNVSVNSMVTLAGIDNFLYLINPENYGSMEDFISVLSATNYDLLIIDYFFDISRVFSPAEILQLKQKANGGHRFVIAYMSIGEAEDYRYYWNDSWYNNPPAWMEEENPDWEGNYIVKYWEQEWQDIIYGSTTSYLDMIIAAGFDGVYLDIIEAYEYFE